MIKVLLILFHLFLFSTGYSQIIPVRNINGIAYDYIDTITKKTISKYAYDQASPFVEGMARVNRNGLFGFINASGEELIPCKYIHANDFSEGLASVSIGTQEITENTIWVRNEKYGVIDKTGQKIIPFEFKEIAQFKNGIARAREMTTRKWGWIDNRGNWHISPKFESADDFNDLGMAKVGVNYDSNGYIDSQGNFLINPVYYELGDFVDGLARAKNWGPKEKYDGKYGFINIKGEYIVPFKYDNVQEFSENLALVGKRNNNGELKFGFIDKKGIEQIALKYEYGHSFSNGMAYVKQDSKFGWINNMGKYTIPNIYDLAEDFRIPMRDLWKHVDQKMKQKKFNSAIISKNGFWGVIDNSGKEILPVVYDSIAKSNDGFITKKNKYTVFFDITGKIIYKEIEINTFEPNYNSGYVSDDRHNDTLFSVERFKEKSRGRNLNGEYISQGGYSKLGPIKVSRNGEKYGIVYENGKFNSRFEYDSIKAISQDGDINHGLVGYKKGKLYILTSSNLPYNTEDTGVTVIPTDFSLIENYYEYTFHPSNLIRVKEGDNYGVISIKDEKIQEIIKPIYQDVGMLPNFNYSDNRFGLIPIKSNGFWGFVDTKSGEIKIPCQFENVGGFNDRDGWDLCQVKKNKKWGIINGNGELVTPLIYQDVLFYSEGLCAVKKDGKWGFVNWLGILVFPCIFDCVSVHYEGSSFVKLNKMEISVDGFGNWLY